MKKIAIILIITMLAVITPITLALWSSDVPAEIPNELISTEIFNANSPENLAKSSSDLYMKMVNGDIDVIDGLNKLVEISAINSKSDIAKNKTRFLEEIQNTKQYFKDDKVSEYKFANTIYKSDKLASIKRIQVHMSGQKYYFIQDYIKEEGEWKICGDNIENAFRVKTKFVYWYI